MIWIQLIILLAAILIGARLKGIGLGLTGILGLVIFVFGFHMRPAEPPLDVMLIILAIVTTTATMQAAGGLDYLVSIAEKIIRSNPSRIIFIGPFVVYFLALFAGTAHIVYSVLPIIAEVSAKKRIRPERPMSIAVIASHVALTGSPMSAATAALAAILAYPGAALDIMKIGIPCCFIGVMAGSISVLRMGKELDQDPVFLEKMKDPDFARSIDSSDNISNKQIRKGAKPAVLIFGITILLIVLAGSFPSLLPRLAAGPPNISVRANGTLTIPAVIEMLTLSGACAIMILTKTSPAEIIRSSLFMSMAVAIVSIFGVVWMSSTFINENQAFLQELLGGLARDHAWTFAFAIFAMGMFMFSQAATTRAMMPLGILLGISNPALIAMFPTVNSDFVLPGYPTLLAAIQIDRTGTTKIGKYVLNHSFMRPGIVTISVAVALGFLMVKIFL